MGRVSVVEPALGICTRRTGGARYVPDFARSRSDWRLSSRFSLVVGPGLSVHARGPVLAGPVERRFQPVDVHQVGQRSESHLRRLFRQLCYPLLFRVIRSSNFQASVVFPNNGSMIPMPRFPPRGPGGRLFPRFVGTIKALRLPAVPPAALRFLRLAVPRDHARFRSRRRCVPQRRAWGWSPGIPVRDLLPWRRQDLPSSWGTPIPVCPCSRPRRPCVPDRCGTLAWPPLR